MNSHHQKWGRYYFSFHVKVVNRVSTLFNERSRSRESVRSIVNRTIQHQNLNSRCKYVGDNRENDLLKFTNTGPYKEFKGKKKIRVWNGWKIIKSKVVYKYVLFSVMSQNQGSFGQLLNKDKSVKLE